MANESGPVESKVTVASFTATVVSFVMGLVLMVWPSMPDTISTPLAAVVTGAVTGVITFAAGWLTKHTNRTDEAAARGKHAN